MTTPVQPVAALGASDSAEEFKVYSLTPDVRFLSRGVQPPSSVYVTASDDLIVGCASSATGEVVTVSYRLLRADGQLILGQFQVLPANDRSVSVHSESLAEGFLLSVSCKANVATTRGVTFLRAFLSDPALGGGQPSYMLMSDYVTTAMAPAHPNGRQLAPTEGPGRVYAAAFLNPGLGADWTLSPPANAKWRIISLLSSFVTSAGGPTRTPHLEIQTGGNPVYFSGPVGIQGGGTLFNYTWATGQPYEFDGVGTVAQPLPDFLVLPPGATISSLTTGIQGTDQWAGQNCLVEEWLDNV